MPWLAIAVGIGMAVKGLINMNMDRRGDAGFLFMGLGLIVLGMIAFFVYRWMAKRGI
jgi:hypothetical protein